MNSSIGATPSTPPPTTTAAFPQQQQQGVQGLSTLGFGPSYSYNPYPSPYPTGLPGSSITSFGPYGAGAYGGAYGAAGAYGGAYGGMMGNPYGGFQNNTGTGGLSPQTGLAPGYGFDRAVSPTVFQGALSGDGSLPDLHPGRANQELFGRENAEQQSNLVGGVASVATFSLLRMVPFSRNVMRNGFGMLLSVGLAALGGTGAKLVAKDHLENINRQKYVALDYADNGVLDGSWLLQRKYETDSPLFG
jgi:hypothetical protein